MDWLRRVPVPLLSLVFILVGQLFLLAGLIALMVRR